jgi:predicted ATP-dependent protease
MWILEDVIEKTLEDARSMAEAAGKKQVELTEVEEALKRLCERYHERWQAETAKEKKAGVNQGRTSGKRR